MNEPAMPRTRPSLLAQLALSIAIILIAISAYPARADDPKNSKISAACPTAADMDHQHLQGRWLAELQTPATTEGRTPPPPTTAVLQLGPHPELAQSVRGTTQRGSTTAQVSGDVDDGDLTLEESINGTNISATWTGRVVDGSCGKEIRGTWNNAHPTPPAPAVIPFVMRRQAGWQ
ncbi:MAG: hypothetical protein QE485_18215 [Acidovorax sp.]|jgi:hypothetical protein|uniref:hypothetical protein n=1 Tax=Acidovorax sp. TaxID=1872122 RepID=UPI00263304E8|nr:hypothetical protein [Acidovorax sp.]MDH4419149.1 hypothetical protein [Acidovorax sp.]